MPGQKLRLVQKSAPVLVYAIWKTAVNIQPGCQKGRIKLHIKTDVPIFIGLRRKFHYF